MRRAVVSLLTAMLAVVSGCAAPEDSPRPAASITLLDNGSHPVETLTPLLTQPLPNVPGKTFTSAIVTFPPAAQAMPHRHGDAFVYAYVLEGAVSSRLEGQPARVYQRGENWTELPGAHHVATENASRSDEAKLLVVFVADTGAPLKTDDLPG